MSPTPRDLSEADVLALSAARGEPEWLRDRRQEAFKAFSDLEWPHARIEEWRYTKPDRFSLDRELAAEAAAAQAPATGIVAAVGAGGEVAGAARIVDGGVVAVELAPELAELGVVLADLSQAAHDHADLLSRHLGDVVGADEKFDALSLAAFTAGVLVAVPDEVEVAAPITVTIQASGQEGTLLPRVLVVAGRFAKANVYVEHAGDGPVTAVEAVEVAVGDGSQVSVVTSQDWGDELEHIGTHRGKVYRDARYRHLETTLGGGTVYLRPDARLEEIGAHAELLGVYFGSGAQHFEHRSLIHHNASRTTSESVYKGALQGRSHATWCGTIRIEEHARATSSDETNRNLILTDGANADSIPFLEILCSDVVECGHHSSIGQLDEVQLFYLQSRGISREEAVRMLVFGFFSEVTDRIELPAVTETVLAEVEREIRSGDLTLTDPRRSGG